MSHIPVLLQEVIESLNLNDGKVIIDGTMGAGGHAKEIIKRISSKGVYLGIELDYKTFFQTSAILKEEFGDNFVKIITHHGNYKDAVVIAKNYKIDGIDGVLLDLGFSSMELEKSGRGFSFKNDEPLDMRYDIDNQITAAGVVNSLQEKELADIIWKYGEERFSRQIAKGIVSARRIKRILLTSQLIEIIQNSVPGFYRKARIHPATKTFQALRIYVNDELGNLKKFLETITQITSVSARIAIISFHSLEDRMVKQFFVALAKDKKAHLVTKKPIVASKQEIIQNPRSRSAKLRVIEII
ncbi:MAG TPA: 16S rRNA (cytosine(1402)-N(4))-methyltransferase RsmH [Candidatus Paceibacterota bacterium]|nr:16S rRNA (cytosine(1402)-N(4))-methyltransferase RsmH [Candidatus Paceibacterota bacterium]